MKSFFLAAALLAAANGAVIEKRANLDYTTSEAGNPFAELTYADPDTEFYNGEYWVYPTPSLPYDEQVYFDAFSSKDLIHWTKHKNILVASDFKWARRAVWAPAPIKRNGKYYLYFAANDIQESEVNPLGGIGVGVADKPEGPYKDALGKPLVGDYHNGAQPIDQDVFIDDDGQAYMYYGGHSFANVVKLNEDMISLGKFDDGTVYKSITPENYVEAPQMIKRNGKYYFMWSEGGWGGPDYAVSYAIADKPDGPFTSRGKILSQDSAVATGSGSHGLINIPGTEIWYIVYHRHPLGATDANDRVLAYDRMYFNEDGTIAPVKMLVHDNFNDGNMIGWEKHGGAWDASSNSLKAASPGGKATLNTNFTDFTMEADVTIPKRSSGSAGILFRAENLGAGDNDYQGYYVGLSTSGKVIVERGDGGKAKQLKSLRGDIRSGVTYNIHVRAQGDHMQVTIKGHKKSSSSEYSYTLDFSVRDGTYTSGKDGVKAVSTDATFDNLKVTHLE